jgi:hypothetical protein
MSQGETLDELEENLRDAYHLMLLDDVLEGFRTRKIAVGSGASWPDSSIMPVAS